jgi:hypothetical protein
LVQHKSSDSVPPPFIKVVSGLFNRFLDWLTCKTIYKWLLSCAALENATVSSQNFRPKTTWQIQNAYHEHSTIAAISLSTIGPSNWPVKIF